MRSMDELQVAQIGRAFIEAVIEERGLKNRPGSEIKIARHGDTCVTTLWHENLPIAHAICERDAFNHAVLTTVLTER